MTRRPDVRHANASWPRVRTRLHSIYDQSHANSVHAQFDRVINALENKLPVVAERVETVGADIAAFAKEIWRQIWNSSPNERLNREIRRRADVVGIPPTGPRPSAWSAPFWSSRTCVGAEGRRYLGRLEVLAESQAVSSTETEATEDITL